MVDTCEDIQAIPYCSCCSHPKNTHRSSDHQAPEQDLQQCISKLFLARESSNRRQIWGGSVQSTRQIWATVVPAPRQIWLTVVQTTRHTQTKVALLQDHSNCNNISTNKKKDTGHSGTNNKTGHIVDENILSKTKKNNTKVPIRRNIQTTKVPITREIRATALSRTGQIQASKR
jgi:hypothetical protein